MNTEENRKEIISLLKTKASTKQDVFHNTIKWFEVLKEVLEQIATEYNAELNNFDPRVEVAYQSRGNHDVKLKVAGDTLLFHMHTNVFSFDDSHGIWSNSYVEKDSLNAYCGMINVYNFLSDSFKYNRENDAGYLIARIFINKENHFFVEGKRQMGFLFNDFQNSQLNKNNLKQIVESCILFSLNFDLLTPDYATMSRISISQIIELTRNIKLTTEKRLGFKLSHENDQVF